MGSGPDSNRQRNDETYGKDHFGRWVEKRFPQQKQDGPKPEPSAQVSADRWPELIQKIDNFMWGDTGSPFKAKGN